MTSASPGGGGRMQWWPFGTEAVLVEFTDPADRWPFRCPGATELVVGARTVLVRFDPRRLRATELMAQARFDPHPDDSPQTHTLPVRYDGPDLTMVARSLGMTEADVVARHSGVTYRAEFCGFAPGFAYLSGLDPALRCPRLAAPRTRVPRGALAIADWYTAVYPTASPGGWNLLGHTEVALFDVAAPRPARIRPGDLVRFEVVR